MECNIVHCKFDSFFKERMVECRAALIKEMYILYIGKPFNCMHGDWCLRPFEHIHSPTPSSSSVELFVSNLEQWLPSPKPRNASSL